MIIEFELFLSLLTNCILFSVDVKSLVPPLLLFALLLLFICIRCLNLDDFEDNISNEKLDFFFCLALYASPSFSISARAFASSSISSPGFLSSTCARVFSSVSVFCELSSTTGISSMDDITIFLESSDVYSFIPGTCAGSTVDTSFTSSHCSF